MDDERGVTPATRGGPLDHILAHDISNYLTIIRGHAEILLSDVDDPAVADSLNTIKRQVVAADAMLQTVGGVARGGAVAELQDVDVADCLSSEADRLESAYPGVSITTELDDRVVVRADGLVLSVFSNLLENAIKHNDAPDPTLHVTAADAGEVVIVTVADNGPGLPGDVRDQLEGRGLAQPQSGVHIVRFLVDKYGGSIAVDTGPAGTTISVELPSGVE